MYQWVNSCIINDSCVCSISLIGDCLVNNVSWSHTPFTLWTSQKCLRYSPWLNAALYGLQPVKGMCVSGDNLGVYMVCIWWQPWCFSLHPIKFFVYATFIVHKNYYTVIVTWLIPRFMIHDRYHILPIFFGNIFIFLARKSQDTAHYLSHNHPCFQYNIVNTNFLVSNTCKIKFHDIIYRTVRMFTLWCHPTQKSQNMAEWVCFEPLFLNLINSVIW